MEDNKIIIETDESDALDREQRDKIRILTFDLGKEVYCVDIRQIKEIVRPLEITRVPNTPQFVVGIMNLRGGILPIIDVRHFIGLEDVERSESTRIIVVSSKSGQMGIIADKVKSTMDITPDMIQSGISASRESTARFTKGGIQFGSDIYAYLDLEKITDCDEINHMRKGE